MAWCVELTASRDVRLVLVIKRSGREVVARIAVRLSRRMAVVQVGSDEVLAKASVVGRQVVVVAHEDGRP